jgi:hypothetical protein
MFSPRTQSTHGTSTILAGAKKKGSEAPTNPTLGARGRHLGARAVRRIPRGTAWEARGDRGHLPPLIGKAT